MKITTTIFFAFVSLTIFVSAYTFAMQQSDTNTDTDTKESKESKELTPEIVIIEETAEDDAVEAAVEAVTDDNPGLPLLDQAIEEKLKAANEQDLNNVLVLAQRAKKEGLQDANLKFCNEFIASVQIQRGILLSSRIVSKSVNNLPESWTIIRTRALNDLESAIKVIKTQPEVFIRIAQLYLMPGGNKEKAKKALDEAENISKNQPDLFTQTIVLKIMLENDPAKREELLAKATKEIEDQRLIFFHALSLIELKKYDDSIKLLKKVLDKEPNNPQALQLLLEVYRMTKQFKESLEILDKLENILSIDAVDLMRAKLLIDMDKKDDAMKTLDKLHDKLSDNIEILLLRATLANEMKKFDKAMKDIDNAINLIGENNKQQIQPLKILQVQILISADKFDEAIKLLDKLEENSANDVTIKILRVEVFQNQKKYEDAINIVESLLSQEPNNIALLKLKGNILLSMHRHLDAVKIFEEVIKADPADKTALNNLSWILSTSPIDMVRNGKRALELAERACQLTDYKAAYILSTLAAAYAELGDYTKAIEFSQKSIELSADDPNVSERVESLKEELETYKKNMPYRELPTDNKK
ncbi:MAG: tetratricopeptide repeat protein [Planctomycetaceae bacterium]|jgi:tetratricopeptide (TPR) repeat protein|nr:tetratricopeptide repeat protein [Planctomycetaceae bacterium]